MIIESSTDLLYKLALQWKCNKQVKFPYKNKSTSIEMCLGIDFFDDRIAI